MDLRTIVTMATLLLVTAASNQTTDQTTPEPNVTQTSVHASTNSMGCSCRDTVPPGPSRPAPFLALLTVSWSSSCGGEVQLIHNQSNSASPVCDSSPTKVQSLLKNVCKDKIGCRNPLSLKKGKIPCTGFSISETGEVEPRIDVALEIHCTIVPDKHGELQAYKVVTALLCCVLLVLLMMRFTRPTVKALQKRLSNRRQNRWIGPTQSHSVSYHRGKTVKNNDEEKRMSYPALERLAVYDSREPSSNRNSDYNL